MNKTTSLLHPSQYEIFVDQLINIDSPHYNIGLYLKLKGDLDKKKFIDAVNSSPKVFDVFKMRFDLNVSDPICYFEDNYEKLEVVEIDFSDRDNPRNNAESWMQEQFNISFILENKNLPFQIVLIKVGANEHWFFFKYHHLITDAYGFVIWINYISQKYKSLIEGNTLQFDYPSYKNEAIKAAEYRNSPNYELDGKFWKEKIGEKRESTLKKNKSFSTKQLKKSGNYYLNLSHEQKKSLDEVVQVTKTDLQQLTIAALIIYLGKISSQSEIVVGIPVHKRGSGQLRNILGMFSGVLPFKDAFSEDMKLTDLLKEIASSRKQDYSHQNYLIIDLIRALKINASENFLFDIIINYVPFNFQLDFGEGVQPSIHWLQSEYEKLPLQICWRDYGNKQPLELAFHYSYEYFTSQEIELLAERIIFILQQFTSTLDTNIGKVDNLPCRERQLLKGFNGLAVSYPRDKSIVDLFEQQVERTPNNIAVVFERQKLSYRELNNRANRLGHFLRSKGVKEDVLVPICIARSVEMMVGILGILKAGGAYVPIDPEYPQDRISYMLQDTGASLILSSKEARSNLPLNKDREVIEIDTEWGNISKNSKHAVSTSLSPHHLAYVIYTSGSTGTPKGVLIEHRSLVASTLSRNSYYDSFGNVFLIPSFSFDSSVAVIFGTLLTGGRLILCEDQLIKEVSFIRDLLKDVQTILCVPSYYRILLEEGIVESSSLTKVIVGGEDLDEQIVSQHFSKTNNVLLYNEYGPTEYTVWATVDKIESDCSKVTIGSPINNTSIYIVNKEGHLNPIGVAGEIYVAGEGLARGYLNNEELSKQKFVSNPFSLEDGARMYKTGDLGSWTSDGKINFIGRLDDQVKIRGYRIQLGEVEAALQQCRLVKQAVVMAKEDKKGGKRLLGYVVPHDGELDREALGYYLSSKLPQYMIPALWVELNQLPLTSNGKIDRKALPEVNASDISNKNFVAPSNFVEKQLCDIWQDIFELEQVGIHDNFFELGGDSLISIKIVSWAKRMGYALQPKDLFLYQNIEKLSKAIIAQSENLIKEKKQEPAVQHTNTTFKSLIPVQTQGSKTPLYLVCGGGGTVFKFKQFIELLDVNQPVYVLQQPAGIKDLHDFPVDIKGNAARYVAEILIQNPNGPYSLAGHCLGGIVAFEMAKQLDLMGKKVELLALFDTIVEEREERHESAISNFFKSIYLKVHFETFLLKKHTKHAMKYKIDKLRSFFNKIWSTKTDGKEDVELQVYADLGGSLKSASKFYEITPINKDLLIFYPKEHYYFLDKEKNIFYRKYKLSDDIKNRWKSYSRSVRFCDIEGEHSSMFDPKYGGKELAKKLQEHLNKFTCKQSIG